MGSLLGNVRLTFAIAALAIGSIAVAIIAVVVGVYISLSTSTASNAIHAVADTNRISAEILRVNLPSLEVLPDSDGNVVALTMRSMPKFRNHGVIDTIAMVAGQNAAIYVYNSEVAPDLTVGTTSFLQDDGERALDMPIVAGTPLFESLIANKAVDAEETIGAASYFTHYQPIAMADGTVIGALMVAVARAPIEAVLGNILWVLAIVAGGVLLVSGAVSLLLSRALTRPIPKLSAAMSAIAAGATATPVPYLERHNEMGMMARAVEVLRRSSERAAELGVETGHHLEVAADHTGQLNAISQAQLVAEFTLTGEIITANQNFLDRLGYRHDELVGQPNARILFDADPASASYRQFWLDLAGGASKNGEYRRQARDGHEVWIQSTFAPILGVDGAPYKVVQFATDVTARVQAVAAVGAALLELAKGDLTQT
ncbi:MAG: PAS domain S-box protein, partial [Alphaproteobacteria bacterium]|nr:PAS domain S-box protein [Alphaproteobacteria bacterium]